MSKNLKKSNVQKDIGAEETPDEQNYIPSSPYSNIRREITEEDLDSQAVQRILLGEVDKLQLKVEELEEVEEKYYTADKKCAVLEEKTKTSTSQEVLYGFCLAIGSAIMGLTSLVWEQDYGYIPLIIGAILVLGGIISKIIKWN